MKARIKGTNIIVECKGIGTLTNENKGIECKHTDGSVEVIPADCLIEVSDTFDIKEQFDWKSFRVEAAKDILCAVLPRIEIIDGNFQQSIVNTIYNSVDVADMLIKQLKEKEEK